jgi:hypothetical protein
MISLAVSLTELAKQSTRVEEVCSAGDKFVLDRSAYEEGEVEC